jgi:hypothetical protein
MFIAFLHLYLFLIHFCTVSVIIIISLRPSLKENYALAFLQRVGRPPTSAQRKVVLLDLNRDLTSLNLRKVSDMKLVRCFRG